jgi:hypothetical protein
MRPNGGVHHLVSTAGVEDKGRKEEVTFLKKSNQKTFAWGRGTSGVSLIAPAGGNQRDTGGAPPPRKSFCALFSKSASCFPA